MKDSLFRFALVFAASSAALECGGDSNLGPSGARDYRQEMRDLVQRISAYAGELRTGFVVIPQNGQELLTTNGKESGTPAWDYLSAVDGVGREDLFFGFDADNVSTPTSERDYMLSFLDMAESHGIEALVTDYCWTASFVDESYARNAGKGYISFAADPRELDDVPSYPATPYNVNPSDVAVLGEARNFLYLINTNRYDGKEDFLGAIRATDYDVVIMDLFFDGTVPFDSIDISSLKEKAGGGSRLILAYMSIGEAEEYRYYWKPEWVENPPAWLAEENPDWPGNYKVRYWEKEWQDVIFGNDASYLRQIVDAGFDGVYLDIIDAFEYFEER